MGIAIPAAAALLPLEPALLLAALPDAAPAVVVVAPPVDECAATVVPLLALVLMTVPLPKTVPLAVVVEAKIGPTAVMLLATEE